MPRKFKLVVNVPLTHVDQVRKALGDAGAGKAGNYTYCSFSVRGTGRWRANDAAKPFIGVAGTADQAEEEQIQTTVLDEDVQAVLAALKASHPYEETDYALFELATL